MNIPPLASAFFFALFAVACSKAPEPASVASPPAARPMANTTATKNDVTDSIHASAEHAIAWQSGDVDAAFAKAKAEGKPLFLYWGAVWCPPCNEVKATIFNRQDFIERSRFFVPVYVDGDAPSAQKLGARFKVSAYPTMVLFTSDGKEITRLPAEVDADQYMRVLALGMNDARPIRETLAAALATGKPGDNAKVSPNDWRMLAYYSWETDETQLAGDGKLPDTLQRLAKACPADQPELATRLWLQALAAVAKAKGAKPRDDKAAVEKLLALLADPKLGRENFDVIVNYADDIAGKSTLPGSSRRAELTQAWNAALERLAADTSLSELDRLTALDAQVALAKLDGPKAKVPETLQQRIRDEAARVDRESRDPYVRQSLVSTAAEVLADADLLDESDALLRSEVARSHSPYYAMLGLALNAKKRGNKAGAVDWAEKAYAAAKGPATRLQWGVRYVSLAIELTPQDAARIEHAAAEVIGELEPSPDTFYERNRRALERMSKNLAAWNKDNSHSEGVRKLRAEMAGVCAKLPAGDPAHAICEGTLRQPSTGKA